jgi:hypothetical protein
MDGLGGYVKLMMRTSTMGMPSTMGMRMGKTITITRSEKMDDGTKNLLSMMKKRRPDMEKKIQIYQVEKTRTHR